MDLTAAIKPRIDASKLTPQELEANTELTQKQKIAEASRQFEAILLQEILNEAEKTVVHSKYDEDSMSSGIYRDMVTKQLATSIADSGSFGLAKMFEQQLTGKSKSAGTDQKSAHLGKPAREIGGKSGLQTSVNTDSDSRSASRTFKNVYQGEIQNFKQLQHIHTHS